MIIDHIGAIFFPEQYVFRKIGRIAFPIFAFLVTDSLIYTRNKVKYLQRLFVFGLISEIPFDLAFGNPIFELSLNNVMFTLLLGAICILIVMKHGYSINSFLCIFACMYVADFLSVDGGSINVLIVLLLYVFRYHYRYLFAIFAILYGFLLGNIYVYALIAIVLIYLYDGTKGCNIKWFSYYIYPLHLTLLYIIAAITY